MPDMMNAMFQSDATASGAAEGGMEAAKSLDMAQDTNLKAAAPTATMKARTVKALTDAANKVLSMFGAPALTVEAVDMKNVELPVDLIKSLMMINAAHNEYIGEDVINLDNMKTDKDALVEIAKLIKVAGDKAFKKFLMSAPAGETKGTEIGEEMGAPEEEGGSEEMMMKRMA